MRTSTGRKQGVSPREPAPERDRADIVQVEVDEGDAEFPEIVGQAARGEQVLRVPPVPRPLAHHDFAGAGATKRLDGAGDDHRVRVDHRAGFVLDEVRLQQHPATANGRPQQLDPSCDGVNRARPVIRRRQQRDLRLNGHGERRPVVRRRPAALAAAASGSAARNSRRVGSKGECRVAISHPFRAYNASALAAKFSGGPLEARLARSACSIVSVDSRCSLIASSARDHASTDGSSLPVGGQPGEAARYLGQRTAILQREERQRRALDIGWSSFPSTFEFP